MIFYFYIYFICAFIFLFCTAVVNGYNTFDLTWRDFVDSLIWPVSLGTYIGLLIRVIIYKRK